MYRLLSLSIVLVVCMLAAVIGVRTMRFTLPSEEPPPAGATISIDAEAAVAHLSRALRIRTISFDREPSASAAAFAEFHRFLQDSFPRVHSAMTRETIAEHSLLYTWAGTDPGLEPILFSAHMDVVPIEPGTEADWIHPPFSGEVADGFVWGRGSLDMKQSLMGYMEAAELLIGQGFAPARTILFAFTHDEEIGAEAARSIAELLEARGVTLYFTLDEGLVITDGIIPGLARPAALIGIAQKGYLTVEIEVHGQGGHTSTPPSDLTSARLAQVIQALVENPLPARLTPPVARMFDDLGPEMAFASRVILANRWLFEPILLSRLEDSAATNAIIRTTFAPSIIAAGVKENVLPQAGVVVVNVRILPGDSVEEVLQYIRSLLDEPGIEVRLRAGEPSEPSRITDPNGPAFQLIRRTVRQVFPDVAVAPGILPAQTDSRHYGRIARNTFLFLPSRMTAEDLPRVHGTNERIAIGNYVEIIRFYTQLMINSAAAFP